MLWLVLPQMILMKKVVNWFLMYFKRGKMNQKLRRSEQSYSKLTTLVTTKIKEIKEFLKENDTTDAEVKLLRRVVKNFEEIGLDSFRYSIHGRDFIVKTEYLLEEDVCAMFLTYETKHLLNNYPNIELIPLSTIQVKIDTLGNFITNKNSGGDVGESYFEVVTDFMYPE